MAKYKVDNLDALFQVGCIVLVKIIDNFATSYSITLSTYEYPITIAGLKYQEICCKILIYKDLYKNKELEKSKNV